MSKRMVRGILVGVLLGVFGLGYLCGSMSQPRANAQGMGGLLDQAGKMGSVGQLGTSIIEMQQHVTGLQKNIDTLKTVQSALSGK